MDYGKIAYLKAVDLEKQLLSIKGDILNVTKNVGKSEKVELNNSGFFSVDTFSFLSFYKEGVVEYLINGLSLQANNIRLELHINGEKVDEKVFSVGSGSFSIGIKSYLEVFKNGENYVEIFVDVTNSIDINRVEVSVSGKKIFKKE